MNTVLISVRLGLAAVFVVAAIAKLLDTPGSRLALEGFAVPARLLTAAAVALPVAELAAAGLLISASSAQVGAAIALVLLLAFVAGIGAALRRGTAPDCHCFGQLHSKPAGRETLIRNGVLAAFGAFVLVAGPGPTVDAWARDSSSELVALAAVSLLAVLLAYVSLTLWEENRELAGRGGQESAPEELAVGEPAPSFVASDLDGRAVASSELLAREQRSVLVFTSATCGPCVDMLPDLAQWRDMLVGRLGIHVLAAGDEETNRQHSEQQGMPLLFDANAKAAQAFRILGTPSAVEVDETGRVAAPAAVGAPAIEGLIRASLKRPAAADGLQVRQVGSPTGMPASGAVS